MSPNISVLYAKMAFFTLLFSLFSGCDSGRDSDGDGVTEPVVIFDHEGLDNRTISHLYEYNGTLFAATDQGLYTKTLASQWQPAGLAQMQVHDIAFLGDHHYIASVREDTEDMPVDRLVETTDGGVSWQTLEHSFGGETEETVYALHYASQNNALYATGADVLAASYDQGRSWEILTGMWGGFSQPLRVVKHNPATNDIWFGGQNAIEQMVLVRYSLDTGEEQRFPDLLPSPSVIYGIEFDPNTDQGVYVSGEGGILKTENNGESWTTLIGDVDYRFYFDLAIDPLDSETLYTGGWDKGVEEPQPLIFEVSTDDGNSWTEYRPTGDNAFGGVRSVLSTVEAGISVVYLGLYGGGVMRVTVL